MDPFEKYYNKALNFLSYRPRSEKEIIDYLNRKKSDTAITQKVIEKLKQERLVDDQSFARLWIESRTRSNPKSIKILILELKQKGIDKNIIDSLINSDNTYNLSDELLAKKLVDKTINRSSFKLDPISQKKLIGKLARRGFSYETIKKVLEI